MIKTESRSPAPLLFFALVSTLINLGLQVYLFSQHFQLKYGGAVGNQSLCSINATFNCEAVAMSPYSELFGIPLSLWGSAFAFIQILFLVSAISGLSVETPRIIRISQLLAGASVIASLIMSGISFTLMTVYCLFCIGAYITSLVTFGALWTIGRPTGSDLAEDLQAAVSSSKWIGIMIVLVPGFAILGNAVMKDRFGADRLKFMIQESLISWKSAPEVAFSPSAGLVKGSDSAPFTIVEFADFLCPHCKHAAPVLSNFYLSRKNVRVIFKPYPLDGSCNKAIERAGDGLRCQLAFFSLCAEKIGGKGWAASDWIFDRQEQHSLARWPEDMKTASAELGLDLTAVESCMKSPEVQAQIDQIVEEGKVGKIRGTPSIFVNGRVLEGGQILEVLRSAYETL